METKDIYTAAGGVTGGNMETKDAMPGYVPAPVVNPDFVAPEDSGAEQDSGTAEGGDEKSADTGGTKSTASKSGSTASKTTTQK